MTDSTQTTEPTQTGNRLEPIVVHPCHICGEPVEFDDDILCAYCLGNMPPKIEPWPEFSALRSGLERAERGMRVELNRLRRAMDGIANVLHNAGIERPMKPQKDD